MNLYIGFCRSQNPNSLVDKQPQNYLALFTKGGLDGQPRKERVLNAVIILDISGSMSEPLSSGAPTGKSRLDLSK
jgi:Mg-chelatase subunit ChlD